MADATYVITRDAAVNPAEIVTLQIASGSTGWGVGTEAAWAECIAESLCVVQARDEEGALAGIGFLVGNSRHAQLVDVAIHPAAQRRGVGRRLVEELIEAARVKGIRYLGVIRDPATPWLQGFYRSVGFDDIDFAMSLPAR